LNPRKRPQIAGYSAMFLAIAVASVIAATAIAVARTRRRAVGFDATESQSLTQAVG